MRRPSELSAEVFAQAQREYAAIVKSAENGNRVDQEFLESLAKSPRNPQTPPPNFFGLAVISAVLIGSAAALFAITKRPKPKVAAKKPTAEKLDKSSKKIQAKL